MKDDNDEGLREMALQIAQLSQTEKSEIKEFAYKSKGKGNRQFNPFSKAVFERDIKTAHIIIILEALLGIKRSKTGFRPRRKAMEALLSGFANAEHSIHDVSSRHVIIQARIFDMIIFLFILYGISAGKISHPKWVFDKEEFDADVINGFWDSIERI